MGGGLEETKEGDSKIDSVLAGAEEPPAGGGGGGGGAAAEPEEDAFEDASGGAGADEKPGAGPGASVEAERGNVTADERAIERATRMAAVEREEAEQTRLEEAYLAQLTVREAALVARQAAWRAQAPAFEAAGAAETVATDAGSAGGMSAGAVGVIVFTPDAIQYATALRRRIALERVRAAAAAAEPAIRVAEAVVAKIVPKTVEEFALAVPAVKRVVSSSGAGAALEGVGGQASAIIECAVRFMLADAELMSRPEGGEWIEFILGSDPRALLSSAVVREIVHMQVAVERFATAGNVALDTVAAACGLVNGCQNHVLLATAAESRVVGLDGTFLGDGRAKSLLDGMNFEVVNDDRNALEQCEAGWVRSMQAGNMLGDGDKTLAQQFRNLEVFVERVNELRMRLGMSPWDATGDVAKMLKTTVGSEKFENSEEGRRGKITLHMLLEQDGEPSMADIRAALVKVDRSVAAAGRAPSAGASHVESVLGLLPGAGGETGRPGSQAMPGKALIGGLPTGSVPEAGGGGGGVEKRSCYNCGGPGHISTNCPKPKGGGKSKGGGGGGQGKLCYVCNSSNHLKADCPAAAAVKATAAANEPAVPAAGAGFDMATFAAMMAEAQKPVIAAIAASGRSVQEAFAGDGP